MPATEHEAEQATSGMMLKDLRVECRARGISPAGGREQLLQRVREHMVETGDW
jgi:SPIRAL1-like protein